MINNSLISNLHIESIEARVKAAHMALGSQITKIAMPETVHANPHYGMPIIGALSVLNDQKHSTLGGEIHLAKFGVVREKKYIKGVLFLEIAVPMYYGIQKTYLGMLFVKMASPSDTLSEFNAVEVNPSNWSVAVSDGEYYWLKGIKLVKGYSDFNPFDYAQALLPPTLKQVSSDVAIQSASLCRFLSEVYRFLQPEDRALYQKIMLKGPRFAKFVKYAASTRSHHNQEHGLLLHSAETVANVLIRASRNDSEHKEPGEQQFDLSLTLLAALLHDGAKVDDYHRLAPNTYSTNFNCSLIGHEQTMLKWIAVACAVSTNYCSERELRLEHAICAVKKQHDQSGTRTRRTKESFVLHDADCASANAYDKGATSVLIAQQFVQGVKV